MMVTYTGIVHDVIVETNKRVYICFLLAFAMLAASPMRAADEATGRKTLVVRPDPRTGRLVRSAAVSRPQPGPARPPAGLNDLIDQAARLHGVDPLLVHSIIQVESNYDPAAISPKGAEGLMQLTPATARKLGVSNSFDPNQSVEAGVKYLKYLQDVYKDDRLALAAYNAGPGAVDKYRTVPPYPETQNYVDRVGKHYGEARRAAAASAPAPEPPAAAATPEHPKLEQFIDENGRLHLRTVP